MIFLREEETRSFAMELLAELEKLTGQAVSASVLLDAPTIRLLTRKLSERGSLGPKHLIQIHSNGSQPPIIFFHGDFRWGGGPLTGGLTNLLGPDQPIFIVIPHGTGDEPIPTSIKAMASDRLPLIVQAQPEGPYRLCGNCLGGIVAFEVARLLLAAGKEVEMVFWIGSADNQRKHIRAVASFDYAACRPFSALFWIMLWPGRGIGSYAFRSFGICRGLGDGPP